MQAEAMARGDGAEVLQNKWELWAKKREVVMCEDVVVDGAVLASQLMCGRITIRTIEKRKRHLTPWYHREHSWRLHWLISVFSLRHVLMFEQDIALDSIHLHDDPKAAANAAESIFIGTKAQSTQRKRRWRR